MKVRYDNLSDVLILQLRPGVAIADVREGPGGRRCYYDDHGELATMEIVDASLQVEFIRTLERRLDDVAKGCLLERKRQKEFAAKRGMPT